MTIDSPQLTNVAKFIDGLNDLSSDTGVTIFAECGDAQLMVDGDDFGFRLADADYEEHGYSVSIVSAE